MAHFPDAIVQERRRNVAAVRRGFGRRGLLQRDMGAGVSGGHPAGQIAALVAIHSCILPIEPLTIPIAEDYITRLGTPPPSAMARLRSPSLFTR
jgi:hypothetical protein